MRLRTRITSNKALLGAGHAFYLCIAVLLLAPFSQAAVSNLSLQDFGKVQLGSSASSSISLSFSASPTFSLHSGSDFSVGTPSCTGGATTSCSVPVNFVPTAPGLRQDALIAKDQSGNLLTTIFLRGIGLAPRLTLFPGTVTTFAGSGSWGYADGSPTLASFRSPAGMALDNRGNLFMADPINQVIRKITLSPTSVSTFAGNGSAGYAGDGGAATSAQLNNPTGVAVDAAGNVYIADQGNNLIRRVDAITGVITTFAGGGSTSSGADQIGDGGPAAKAILSGPNDVTVDSGGNVYIADSFHGLVRKVTLVTGTISVVAGGGAGGGSDGLGDGLAGTAAILDDPMSVAVDSAGNLYISDTGHNLVRVVNASSGIISVAAGNESYAYYGDGGSATKAALAQPAGLQVDAAGNLYIADYGNNVVRVVGAASGVIRTIAGNGFGGYTGDGGIATSANFRNPTALTIDAMENLYIVDTSNNVIRKVTASLPTLTFPSTNVGITSQTETVSALNTGSQNLAFSNLSVTANFQQVSSGGTDCSISSPLAPGALCSAGIAFVPQTAGSLTGSVAFTSNSLNHANSAQTINLSGTAVSVALPAVTFSTQSLSFGNQSVGAISAGQTITISNSGSDALLISGMWLAGSNAGDFNISTTCPSSMAAGSNCTVVVTFSPALLGSRSASLAISDNAPQSPQQVNLGGTGVLDGYYEIVSRNSGLVMDVVGMSTAAGALIQQAPYWGGANQQWQFVPIGNGYYTIISRNSSLALDVVGISTAAGALVQQAGYWGGSNQQWQLVPAGNGYYAILSRNSNLALDVVGISTAAGALVQQAGYWGGANQQWQITAAPNVAAPTFTGVFEIVARNSGLALDVSGISTSAGAVIDQYSYWGGANQQWRLIPCGGGYYAIIAQNSEMAIEVRGASRSLGATIDQSPFVGAANQKWQLVPTSNGYYEIMSASSGMVLDVSGISTSNGAVIDQYSYWGGANQQWKLVQVGQ